MAKLFKNKILKQKLETFTVNNFEQKLEVVQKWHTDYHKGTLKTDKEISRAPGWTQDFLGEILGYIRKPSEAHTYDTEYTVAGQRPDFVLGYFHTGKNYIIGELKDAKTSLDAPQKREGSLTPVQQAFKYKGNLRDSSFVIVSNFFETRLYYDNYLDYEMWNLDSLINPKNDYFELRKFIFLLSEHNLIAKRGESTTKGLISFIQNQQKEITKGFYKEYSLLRKELFKDIIVQAKESGKIYKKSELDTILSKTQKIIDRIIFIHFCEDLDLLPQGKLKENLTRAEEIGFSPWEMLKKFFEFVNSGSDRLGIPNGYNGGLFHKDEELEALEVGDEICKKFVDLGEYDFEDDLSVNILGHIFEQSISDIEELKEKIQKNEEFALSKRKKDGVFYTPEYIVDYIVKNSVGKKIEDWEQEFKEKHNLKEGINDKNYTKRAILVYSQLQEKLQNITVLDPACGSGAFLVKVFDFLLAKNEEITKTLEDLGIHQGLFSSSAHFKSILQNNIYGVDLNEESVEITKLSLWLKTAIKGKKLANLDSNIKCGNSLIDDSAIAGDKAFSWETEFPQIFKDGGFDVIVGNPPYLRVQGLQSFHGESTKYYEEKYQSATGRYDIYILFLEKSFQLINKGGEVSFILPHKFLISDFGEGIREFFVKNKAVKSILHFGAEMVFSDASTYTCITNLSHNNEGIKFKNIIPANIIEPFTYDIATYDGLSKDKWNLRNIGTEKVFSKINANNFKVSDIFESISQGIVSVGDDIFLLRGKIENEKFVGYSEKIKSIVTLEKDIVKPLLKGEDVKKYASLENNYFCLYPHTEVDGKTLPLDEDIFKDTFPLAYEYILPFKQELIDKKVKYKTNPKAWYSLHRSREISLFEQEKIITPEISLGSNMTLDRDYMYHNTKCYTLAKKKETEEDYKYFLAIFNSKIFWFFLSYTGYVLRGGYFTFKTKYIEPFPLPQLKNISEQTPFIEKADFMLENNKEVNLLVGRFLKRVQGTFELEKLSKKLQAFYQLDFSDFVKELKKLKVVLSLKAQDEWEEYFDSYKGEIVELKTKIDTCDKEIDEMVFDLYGLSEEEREVVVNS